MTKNEVLSWARQNQFLTRANFLLPCLFFFFFSVQLFVFNAGIDLWPREGSYAKQYKLHLLTNIRNAIELSFISGGVSLNFPRLCYEEVVLWIPHFLKTGTPFFFFFFPLPSRTHICLCPFQSLHLSLRSVDLNDPLDELSKPLHAQHLQEIEDFSCGKSESLTQYPTSPLSRV